MKIWLPNVLYNTIPLVSVLTGFLLVMFAHNPFSIVLATCLYVYSFRVLWLRLPGEDQE